MRYKRLYIRINLARFRMDIQSAQKNESFYQCCSGFCIDLLQKFSEEIGFTYELARVEDGKWGTLEVLNVKNSKDRRRRRRRRRRDIIFPLIIFFPFGPLSIFPLERKVEWPYSGFG